MGLLIMLERGGSLSLQELCFQYVEAALLPNTLVSDGFFVGLLIMLGRGGSLSLQELCFE